MADPRNSDGGCNCARPAKTFLRWAGSKRQQLARLSAFWSDNHTGYVEPFAGSACLFFSIAPTMAVLGDSNVELIEVYKVVRDKPDELHERLCKIGRDRESYNRWRALKPQALDAETRVLRFIYLNRNCFNGIYRTNTEGHFNVPMGRRTGIYFSKDDLVRCADLLKGAILVADDFQETLKLVRQGNFVYLDPPYAVNSRRIFRQYGRNVFTTADIPRLAESLTEIKRLGADFLVSYADCAESRALARNWNSLRLPARRHVAGFAGARKKAYEWLITNLPVNRTSGSLTAR
jgi:DNA adenine methylase